MNKDLWSKIERFDVNSTSNGNGFSLRLAKENNWSYNFAKEAIHEYKKFMYLAAVCDFMVSPSRIVDEVWHLHLTYTKSYRSFCETLGKKIDHNPSDFSDTDFEIYKTAKEKTRIEYEKCFGSQPVEYWKNSGMFDQVSFEKAKYKLRTKAVFLLLGFIITFYPMFLLTKPLITFIDGSVFLMMNLALFFVTFILLEVYNRYTLTKILNNLNAGCFLFDLTPLEMVYLKRDKLAEVVHGVTNNYIKTKKIKVSDDSKIYPIKINFSSEDYNEPVLSYISDKGSYYPQVLSKVIHRSNYLNIKNSMDATKKYFLKSKLFNKVAMLNMFFLMLLLTISFLRLSNGLIREKPVGFLFVLIVVMLFSSVMFVNRLLNLITKKLIPEYYETKILTDTKLKENWAWNYFKYGEALFAAEFTALVKYTNSFTSDTGSASSCGSTCGSSCGSSCGGGCGGCGGD